MGKKDKRKAQDDSACVGDCAVEGDTPQAEVMTMMTTPHKKHKKHKKSKEDGQEVKEDPTNYSLQSDEQKPNKKKKKKKRKAEDEDGVSGEDINPPKAKKQKLCEKDVNGKCNKSETSGEHALEVAANISKKKKKKAAASVVVSGESTVNTSELEGSLIEVNSACDNNTNSIEGQGKQAKEKKRPKQDDSIPSGTESLLENGPQDTASDSSSKEKRKSRKHKSKQAEENPMISSVSSGGGDFVPEKEKKEKCKKNKSNVEIEKDKNGLANGPQENEKIFASEVKKTKKKKEKTEKSKASKCEEENKADECKGITEDVKQQKKDKQKKKKQKLEQSVDQEELAVHSDKDSTEAVKPKKESKKKKKAEKLEESTFETQNDSKDLAAEPKEQKKERKSKEKKNKQNLSAAGNDCAEEVDAKQKDNSADQGQTGSPQVTSVGQWSSNMFQSSERQNKFMRLLGGFKKAGDASSGSAATGKKKGLFGSLQLKQESNTGGQRALTYQAAQEIDKRLESDYERALTFSARGQRGIGLGFTPDPAEGKKFHIDTNKVASKKFLD